MHLVDDEQRREKNSRANDAEGGQQYWDGPFVRKVGCDFHLERIVRVVSDKGVGEVGDD